MDDLIEYMESVCECVLYEEDGEICPVCMGINEIKVLRKESAYWKALAQRLMKIHG
jgi:hypothetical protein